MKGFFSIVPGRRTGCEQRVQRAIAEPRKAEMLETDPCEKCGLYKGCLSPRMSYTGEGRLKCLIVAEAPGAEEDRRGVQLVGDAGQLFREKLEVHGLDLDRDFWKINSVNCHPPGNRKPTRREIKCCRFMVEWAIEECRPRFIWLLGGSAVESFYLGRFSRLGITRWRRWCIPDRRTGAWIIPLFHPSYVLRNEHDENLQSLYDRDLKWAVSCFRKGPPQFEDFESKVRVLTEFSDVRTLLKDISAGVYPTIAFDYETTGLKPYDRGHMIWTIAVATDKDHSYAFPFDYPHWRPHHRRFIRDTWSSILENGKVRKVAHNLKFEDVWSRNIFGVDVKGWDWCTMLGAHILDNRKDITGLKFQSYVRYGVEGYEKEVKKYIEPRPGEKINRLNEVPLGRLLLYNGMDAVLTYRLYEDQRRVFWKRERLERARRFFLEGAKVLSEVQDVGIRADLDYYEEQEEALRKEEERLEKELRSSRDAREFEKRTGRVINLRSDKDLRELLFKVKKLKPTKLTPNGQPSVDKEVMEKLGVGFSEKIIRLRKVEKIRGTYLAQFVREVSDDGRLHPFFDLHLARTYRSSSSNPNFQNIPVRDEEAKRVTRGGLLPSPGNCICEGDYGSLEVRIAACYTRDRSLVKYVSDPTTDMHRDSAMDLFLLPLEEVTKTIRFYGKNGWVFPQFYGDWYKSCAQGLWENCVKAGLETASGVPLKEHLRDQGIKTYKDFEEHCREVEYRFWYERFREYQQWKDEINEFYRRKGYIETFLGFRYSGYINYKEATNYPIQGTAFHCLLWSLIQIARLIKKEKLRTRIIGQIHDSIVFDLVPEEKDFLLPEVKRIMTRDIREEFDWIIVPMEAEFEITEVDQAWYYKKEIEV